jgi:hypothetical protein
MKQRFRHGELTQTIIGAYYDVFNALAMDFLRQFMKMLWRSSYDRRGTIFSNKNRYRSIMPNRSLGSTTRIFL